MNRGGNVVRQVVVPEGLTSWQVVELLKARPELTGEVAEVPAEGSLAPAGYDFQRGDERADVIARMQAQQEEILAAAWAGRAADLPLRSPEELLTLASIVEKETGVPEERARVASVFVNRLRRGMRLQTDPTVIYGITSGEGALGRGLRASELATRDALQHLHASPGCRRRRSPTRARRRSRRRRTRRRATSLLRRGRHRRACLRPRRWRSTTATSRPGAGSRRSGRRTSGRRPRRPRRPLLRRRRRRPTEAEGMPGEVDGPMPRAVAAT